MNRSRRVLIAAVCLSALAASLTPGGKAKAVEGKSGTASAQDERRIAAPRLGGFDVEVVVRGRPLEAIYGRGRRYVEAVEGAEYELVLRNPLPVRVAVALSVDGLNTIDARRASSWDSSKWVIEPYGTIRVSGWQMSSRHARRFYFTTERDSYAARLGRASDLGVISAVFYREDAPRPVPVTPPVYRDDRGSPREGAKERSRSESPPEQMNRAEGAGRGAITSPPPRDDEYAATGIGRSVEHQVSWVDMRLERRPAAEITLRYEYRDALIRLGVLPRPRPYEDALRRRERARGFEEPGFCPEP